jgi:glutaminyl-peptide cyclotransferase
MKNKVLFKLLAICLTILTFIGIYKTYPVSKSQFNSENAFNMLADLQKFGPRIPGSAAHKLSVDYISNQLHTNGWHVQIQSGNMLNHPVYNIIATRNGINNSVILASHYDSRMIANNEKLVGNRSLPVPGANDGGSSSAVLLELSRVLDPATTTNIVLVFFDAEDQGNIDGWDWILGSRLFVNQNKDLPSKVILLDMIGGFDQKIIPPINSDPEIYKDIQNIANKLGFSDQFRSPSQSGILDDHVPFIEKGIPSVDLIDIIDPHWHTSLDDLENVSMQSLQRVGDTLYFWILSQNN